jgi:hypothetical protein
MKPIVLEISSASVTWWTPGAVDWPPMSMMAAPSLHFWKVREYKEFITCCSFSLSLGRFKPPSEKESGVRFMIAITWVRRVDCSARMGCNERFNGVRVDIGDVDGGRALR